MANMSPSIVKNYAQRKASVRTKWQLYVLCVCVEQRGARLRGYKKEVKHFTVMRVWPRVLGVGWQLWSNGVLMAL